MCGILFILSRANKPEQHCRKYLLDSLARRGPDHSDSICNVINFDGADDLLVSFFSSVLYLRGEKMSCQPAVDVEGNILAWNGEIFGFITDKSEPALEIQVNNLDQLSETNAESDTSKLLGMLERCKADEDKIFRVFRNIQGPFAFVYFCKCTNIIYFGRDVLGRRSLVFQTTSNGGFYLASVLPFPDLIGTTGSRFGEVPPNRLFRLPLQHGTSEITGVIVRNIFGPEVTVFRQSEKIKSMHPFYPLKNSESYFDICLESSAVRRQVDQLHKLLRESVKRRVEHAVQFCKNCLQPCSHANFAVLFSGGLDSMLVAYLCNEFVPRNQPVDLLNVVFFSPDGPRPTAPDRLTGRQSYKNLCAVFPLRTWNFVEIDVPKAEMVSIRSERLWKILLPQESVLDSSIGTALWFAARGQGTLQPDGSDYTSPARVVFSGLGADELFGGYSRHRSCFDKSGGDWVRLSEELEEDIRRIGTRNCGRDDRLISDHGREVRYPFLDETVVQFMTSLHANQKCDLNLPRGLGDKLLLRLMAFSLGLKEVAFLEKRAMQFGCRIAKVDGTKSGKEQSTMFLTKTPANPVLNSSDFFLGELECKT